MKLFSLALCIFEPSRYNLIIIGIIKTVQFYLMFQCFQFSKRHAATY